jgi:hypothetical protein
MAVSAKNFRFISPGIRIEEIDRSQIPAADPAIGACIVGRAARGRAFTPVEVRSFSDFVSEFGEPVVGGKGGDIWRDGNFTSPMYATYAAQSWLKNGEALTFIRTLGVESDNKSAAGVAGWKVGTADFNAAYNAATNGGGAYALVVAPSASYATPTTGSVVAVWYLEQGSMFLNGKDLGDTTKGGETIASSSALLLNLNQDKFSVGFETAQGLPSGTFEFDFTKGSSNYIRNVFNTDPTLLGRSSPDNGEVKYFLGETYENSVPAATQHMAAIVGLGTASVTPVHAGAAAAVFSNVVFHDVRRGALQSQTYAKSGWFLSQDLSSDTASWKTGDDEYENIDNDRVKRLFRLVGLDAGEWTQKNLKVSVVNNRAPANEDVNPYGTFDIVLRDIRDSDDDKKIVERFSGCTLDPNSDNYIAKVIGDKFISYDESTNRIIEKGEYENRSKYCRVELAPEFENGFSTPYAVFGVTGPTKFTGTEFAPSAESGSGGIIGGLGHRIGSNRLSGGDGGAILSGSSLLTAGITFNFPGVATRSNTNNLEDFRVATFGAQPTPDKSNNFKSDTLDLVRVKPDNVTAQYQRVANALDYQFITFLDNVVIKSADLNSDITTLQASASNLVYDTASRAGGYSLTATSSYPSNFNAGPSADAATYKAVLNAGAGNLTTLFFGATDGFDITQSDPLAQHLIASNTINDRIDKYEVFTYYRAIESIKNPEMVSYNVVSIPGLINESLTNQLIENTEERADALAVIDVPFGFIPKHERLYSNVSTFNLNVDSNGDLRQSVNTVKGRKYNSSYASTYYPWVKIRDNINARDVFVPPSIAALGAMSYTDRVQAPWFAPAGFNRGGLSSGVSGLPVVSTALKLFKDDRDDLYEINVNPIATFPNEGVVIFGQKTLQVESSALDRINVRRLLVFLKRGVSRIANGVLFEPNVPDTWSNFKNQATPFLNDVKTRFGLTDYKLVLDETTTTPDLIDQNILYAKLFIKPARAIEFIALDFIITNTGASFDD